MTVQTSWGVRDLSVRIGRAAALLDVTMEVARGEVVAVVGGDGAGKTTLLRTLVGAIVPSTGTLSRPALREIGFMPTTSGTWRELTVDENVDFVAAVYGVRGAELGRRRIALLAGAGLTGARDRLAGDLSGGMRQKLAFVLALLHRPRLLVLDEPSTGVDPVSRIELWRMISGAAADGTAVVMSTTYLDEAERASSVLVLDAGRALLSGSPDQVVRDAPGCMSVTDVPLVRVHAWRRGRRFHEWSPEPLKDRESVPFDLEDAVIAAALTRGKSDG